VAHPTVCSCHFGQPANRGATPPLAILTGRLTAHWCQGVLRVKTEVRSYYIPNFQMVKKKTPSANHKSGLHNPDDRPLFTLVPSSFQWTAPNGDRCFATCQIQEVPFDDRRSDCSFVLNEGKELIVSDQAYKVVGMELVTECLKRLSALALTHEGIYFQQHFQLDGIPYHLWFTDEGKNSPISVDVTQRHSEPAPPVPRVVQEWIELSRKYKGNPGEARVLDIVKHNGKYYFVDDRMKELRNVEDFMDVIKFKTAGELMSCRINDCIQVT
jgi:hypothetical protein